MQDLGDREKGCKVPSSGQETDIAIPDATLGLHKDRPTDPQARVKEP